MVRLWCLYFVQPDVCFNVLTAQFTTVVPAFRRRLAARKALSLWECVIPVIIHMTVTTSEDVSRCRVRLSTRSAEMACWCHTLSPTFRSSPLGSQISLDHLWTLNLIQWRRIVDLESKVLDSNQVFYLSYKQTSIESLLCVRHWPLAFYIHYFI